jgi:hypothetical protein
MFVTSQGSAYSQFKRCPRTAELPARVDDGGGASEGPARRRPGATAAGARPATVALRESSAALARARLCDEARLTLPEAQLALAALHALSGPGAAGGGQALVAVCSAHAHDDAVGLLDGWLDSHD